MSKQEIEIFISLDWDSTYEEDINYIAGNLWDPKTTTLCQEAWLILCIKYMIETYRIPDSYATVDLEIDFNAIKHFVLHPNDSNRAFKAAIALRDSIIGSCDHLVMDDLDAKYDQLKEDALLPGFYGSKFCKNEERL